jgi:2-polyprenyl-3-methyl-5-hydroxy-6-metoxy-1,4-benzoquinol methylase
MSESQTDEMIDQQVQELAERLFLGGVAAFELMTIHLGAELGLYAALAGSDGATPPELAAATAIHPRYAQEWLEQQAAAGLIDVDDVAKAPEARLFRLPAAHAEVLLREESLFYTAPIGGLVSSFGQLMPRLVQAYRSGAGIPYGDYGQYLRDAQGAFNRPAFLNTLAPEWMASGLPDLHERLQSDPPAAILDVACGYGWSSIGLARAYPHVEVVAIDLDEPSIERARQHAKEAGVDDRVSFRVLDAASPELRGRFDAVFVFEALHDMAHPVAVLAAIRNARADAGTVVIMDERVGELFSAPADEVERFMYAASVLHCLPAGMTDHPSAATGTVMRPETLRHYASEAGFSQVDILPIQHDFFRFYRLAD